MQKLTLQNRKGLKIVGELETPNQEPKGTCIVQHGYSGFKEQPHVIAMKNAFLEQGFVTFNFDTTNSFGESDGKLEDSRIGLHADDLEDVVTWAKEQDWFVEPLALTGTSMGGYSVLSYAENHPGDVSYCVPVAPVVSGKLIHESNQEKDPDGYKKWQETGWLEKESSSKSGVIKRSPWDLMVEYMNHDLLPQADKLTMPILLIGGSEDTSIPIKHLEILFDAIPEGNKTFEILEGLPHTPRKQEQLELLKSTIANWLEKQS